jgi:hypothetical protein
MTSKIRITATALAAAFAVAVSATSVVPAAHAKDSIQPILIGEKCDQLWDQFAISVSLAAKADRAGNTVDRDIFLEGARQAKKQAQMFGCDWATRSATVDSLREGPGMDGLLTQGSSDSPTTGSDPTGTTTTDPVQSETPGTGSSSADTNTSKPKHKRTCKKGKHKHAKSKSRCKRK